uniref:Uncharacterized protein n=1 Tax=Onchocerca volvulus TaxID=6282 RepID=A0A8R1XNH5_ONCVO
MKKNKFNEPTTYLQYVKYRIKKIFSDLKQIYTIKFVRKWSLWWAMTTCMSLQARFTGNLLENKEITNEILNNLFVILKNSNIILEHSLKNFLKETFSIALFLKLSNGNSNKE